MLKGDWPKTIEKTVGVYDPEDLNRFLGSLPNSDERDIFLAFLSTGFRHMELATLEWADIDWRRRKPSQCAPKADLGFFPKTCEEKEMSQCIPTLRECPPRSIRGPYESNTDLPIPGPPQETELWRGSD